MFRIAISLFLSGVALGFGPCLASCGPLLGGYIASRARNYKQAFWDWLLFSGGRILAYCVLGFFFGNISFFLKKHIPILGGLFIILIGLIVLAQTTSRFKICSFFNACSINRINSALGFGFIVGLLPCMPLIGIFSTIAMMSRSAAEGVLYSFIFGIGTLFSPLILLVFGLGSLEKGLRNSKIKLILSRVCAIIVILYGFLVLLTALKREL